MLADRTGDLAASRVARGTPRSTRQGSTWPGRAVDALDLGHLVFVSSINAYPGWPEDHVDEDGPVWTSATITGLKVACERAAEAAMPGRVAIVAPGCCTAPTNIGRLTWWVKRVAAGGDVLAPGDPDAVAADRRA